MGTGLHASGAAHRRRGGGACADDNSFAKPVSSCAVSMLRSCDAARKRNELLYIGRFAPHKGQVRASTTCPVMREHVTSVFLLPGG